MTNHYVKAFLDETKQIADRVSVDDIEKTVDVLVKVRNEKGRIFFLGVGGSAANCTHAVNDFRKICGIESYSPLDNVAELTARINDEGWESSLREWLRSSNLRPNDTLFILSVGGGNKEKNVSTNLISAIDFAKEVGASVLGIVGRDGGYTRQQANASILVPTVNENSITPHAEGWQGVLWHLLVSHPKLLAKTTKWESVGR